MNLLVNIYGNYEDCYGLLLTKEYEVIDLSKVNTFFNIMDIKNEIEKEGCVIDIILTTREIDYSLYIETHSVKKDSMFGGLYKLGKDVFVEYLCDRVINELQKRAVK